MINKAVVYRQFIPRGYDVVLLFSSCGVLSREERNELQKFYVQVSRVFKEKYEIPWTIIINGKTSTLLDI